MSTPDSDIQTLTPEEFEALQEQGYQIVGACIAVHREMGSSFERELYIECLRYELEFRGIPFEENPEIELHYRDKLLEIKAHGEFLCYGETLIRVEAVPKLFGHHRPQLHQLLKQANVPQGLVANFGAFPKLRWEKVLLHLPEDGYEWDDRDQDEDSDHDHDRDHDDDHR